MASVQFNLQIIVQTHFTPRSALPHTYKVLTPCMPRDAPPHDACLPFGSQNVNKEIDSQNGENGRRAVWRCIPHCARGYKNKSSFCNRKKFRINQNDQLTTSRSSSSSLSDTSTPFKSTSLESESCYSKKNIMKDGPNTSKPSSIFTVHSQKQLQ